MFKKILLFTLVVSQITLYSSCKKNTIHDSITPVLSANQINETQLCTERSLSNSANHRTEAAVLNSKMWAPGDVIKVKFLNGNLEDQRYVQYCANQWQQVANIKFQYVTNTEIADVRIGFQLNGDLKTWSYIGTDCKNINQNLPTMNFGMSNYGVQVDGKFWGSSLRGEILHQFGHALGLVHESQNPTAGIQWNKPALYAFYSAEPFFWSQSYVDENIINKYNTTQTNYTQYDPLSIMLYNIPSKLTIDGYTVKKDSTLSILDRTFINQLYPFAKEQNKLYPGQSLKQNEFIKSLDGRFKLVMQNDGNLVLYKTGAPIWSTSTYGKPYITHCDMQIDGNLVLYSNTNTPFWHSNTYSEYGSYLIIQNDGNLVLYQDGNPVWQSATY